MNATELTGQTGDFKFKDIFTYMSRPLFSPRSYLPDKFPQLTGDTSTHLLRSNNPITLPSFQQNDTRTSLILILLRLDLFNHQDIHVHKMARFQMARQTHEQQDSEGAGSDPHQRAESSSFKGEGREDRGAEDRTRRSDRGGRHRKRGGARESQRE